MLKEEGRQVAQHQQSEGGGHAGHPSPTSLKSFWCNKYDLPLGSLWSIYTRGFRLPEEELETASQNVNIMCSVERVPVVLQGKNIQIYKVYKKTWHLCKNSVKGWKQQTNKVEIYQRHSLNILTDAKAIGHDYCFRENFRRECTECVH